MSTESPLSMPYYHTAFIYYKFTTPAVLDDGFILHSNPKIFKIHLKLLSSIPGLIFNSLPVHALETQQVIMRIIGYIWGKFRRHVNSQIPRY